MMSISTLLRCLMENKGKQSHLKDERTLRRNTTYFLIYFLFVVIKIIIHTLIILEIMVCVSL